MRLRALLVLAVSSAFIYTSTASAGLLSFLKPKPAESYIVVLNEDVLPAPLDDVAGLVTTLVATYGGNITHIYEHALIGFAAELTPSQVTDLLADPRIGLIEKDQIMGISATQNNATWGLDRIDQRNLPLDSQYSYDNDGAGAHVYIIDTGIRNSHQEFTGRIGTGFNAVATGGGGFLGLFSANDVKANFLFGGGDGFGGLFGGGGGGGNDTPATEDCNGHGTHVASTAAGTTWGVAKKATVHAVRVLDCGGSGLNSDVIEGVDWVTGNHQKPAVANMSLGGGASSALDQAVRNSIAAGVSYAVAAGNDNVDACGGSPNRVAEAVTVGSTESDDDRSSFSNHGTCVDIFAPGTSIRAASHSNDTGSKNLSGTSMASPHVAGAAALILSENPGATPAQVMSELTNSATPNVLSNIRTGSPNLLLYTGN